MKQFLLTTIICLSMAISSFAQESGQLTETITWELSGSTLIISGTGAMPDYSYPWYPYHLSIQSVIISDGVTNIGNYAFYSCSALTSVTMGNSVISIGRDAFWYCSALTSITIPNSVISIGEYAFSRCSALASVTMGNSVTSIGEYAFDGCSALASVTMGNSVTSIGERAFRDCSSLASITIPNSVTSIGCSAFSGCSALTTLNYNAISCSISFLFNYPSNGWEELTTVIIGEKVEIIPDYAFAFCGALTSITIPNSVTSIGNGAFFLCFALTSITIPDGVTSIGNNTFDNCLSLTSITIPDGVTNIGGCAFSDCITLASITLPDGVTNIGDNAFEYCFALTSIVIPNTVTSIGRGVFYNCRALTSATIGNGVTSVGDRAFCNCYKLKDLHVKWELPPTISAYILEGVTVSSCTLYVPYGSKKHYEEAAVWKDFLTIQEEADVNITAISLPVNGGVIAGNTKYAYDELVSLEAIARINYTFQCWTEGETVVSTSSVYSFTATKSRNLYAVFVPKENADETITITPQPTSAAIVWEVVNGAQTYTLVIYADAAQTQELHRVGLDVNGNVIRSATAVLSHSVQGLQPDTDYYYALTSYNADNQALTMASGDFTTQSVSAINQVENIVIHAYPNPVSERLYISEATQSIEIYDTTGRLVISQTDATNGIDVSGLNNGIYIITIKTEAATVTRKIVKQ